MKKEEALRLWKAKGGRIEGPNVDQLTISMEAFWGFLDDFEEVRSMEILEGIAARRVQERQDKEDGR